MMHGMTSALALAALLGLAQIRGAAAQEMQVIQGGENFEVQWSGGPRDNLAGGGAARLSGGGQDRSLTHDEPGSTMGQPGMASMSGGGNDMTITHTQPQAPETMLAGQAPAAANR